MDQISAAIIAAIASGIGETGKKMFVDAYGALKGVFKKKFGVDSKVVVAVEELEKDPESKPRQDVLKDEVAAVKAGEDDEIMQLADALVKALKDTPEGRAAISKYKVKAEKIGIVGDNAHVDKQSF